jgi:hypothetical protein
MLYFPLCLPNSCLQSLTLRPSLAAALPVLSYILCSLLSPPSLSPHFLLSPSLSGFTTISISLFRKLIRDEVNAISALSPAGARATSGELGPRSIRPLVYSSDRPVLRSVRFIKTTCLHVLSSLFLVVYILAPVILSTYHPLSSAVGGCTDERIQQARSSSGSSLSRMESSNRCIGARERRQYILRFEDPSDDTLCLPTLIPSEHV